MDSTNILARAQRTPMGKEKADHTNESFRVFTPSPHHTHTPPPAKKSCLQTKKSCVLVGAYDEYIFDDSMNFSRLDNGYRWMPVNQ